MNALRYGGAIIAIAGMIVAYLIGPPWRHLILSTELIGLIIAVVWLQVRMRRVERSVHQHQVQLEAIAVVASKARVISDARQVVEEALTHELRRGRVVDVG